MRIKIRKMGNSRGIIIPKPLLQQSGLVDEVELHLDGDRIILSRPSNPNPREGWAEASRQISKSGDDSLLWPQFGNEKDGDLEW
jgi:antitoxin MazE